MAWIALGAAAHAACALHLVADFKVTMSDSSPLVQARINGGDVTLIADSGAFFSSLSAGTVEQFKLSRSWVDPFLYTIGIGGTQSLSITTVKSFTVADQTLPNVEFLVIDNEVGPGVAGLMGENILGIADAYYDLPDGVIKLIRPAGCDRPFLLWDNTLPTSIVHLVPGDGRFKTILVEAYVNGRQVLAELDSGSATSLLTADAARRVGLSLDGAGVTSGGLTRGIGRRMVATTIVPVESFKIGDEEVKHTRLRVGSVNLPKVDMLLGDDFLLSHRVYVANSQRRLYFTYVGGPVFNLAAPPPSQASPPNPPPAAGPAVAVASAAPPPAPVNDGSFGPTDADGFSRRGMANAGRRQFALAIADLTRAVDLAPKDSRYLTERARVYLESGQPDRAGPDLDKALTLDPGDARARVTRAALRLARKDKAGAIADLDAADRILPKEADLRQELAGLYGGADAGRAAIGQLDLWIAAHRDDNRLPMALNARCWDRALFDVGADQAAADCDAALRRGRRAQVLDSRGLAHLRTGDLDRAIADYDAALALDPKIAWSRYGRGLAELRKGRKAEGQADLAAAAALDPKLPAYAAAHGFTP